MVLGSLSGGLSFNTAGSVGSKWLVVRKYVPASIGVYEPTWLPSRVSHAQPDGYMVSGGGATWDYAVWYTENRIWGDRASLNFGEGPLTCPSPSCLKDGLGVRQRIPVSRKEVLPQEQLFIRRHAPELVLLWRSQGHDYEIEAHSLSLRDVLRVAVSLRSVVLH